MKHSEVVMKQITQPKSQFRELGEVAVDSGQLMLADPAYLEGLDGSQFREQMLSGGVHVEEPLETGGVLNGAQISNTWGKKYLGLNISGFGRDGVFPVRGVYEGDEMVGIVIDFRENRWEAFESERITEEEFNQLQEEHKTPKSAAVVAA